MKNNIINFINYLRNTRIAPVYTVTYAPIDSRNPELPIQKYNIIEHPRKMAWKSKEGNRLFTALSSNKTCHFISFRADRVLSVNFSGWKILLPKVNNKVAKTLVTNFSPPVMAN